MDIYAINIQDPVSEREYDALSRLLDEAARTRLGKFFKKEDALRSLYGEILVRSRLAERLGTGIRDLVLEKTAFGKPFLPRSPDLHFNLSHSGDWACCAIDSMKLGIDVEKMKPIDMKIADRFFSEREAAGLFSKPEADRLKCFYDIWTLKESYIKAIGKGLSIPLDSFSILIDKESIRVESQTEPEHFHFRQYQLAPGYTLSLCARSAELPRTFTLCSIRDLCKRLLADE
jgi:4'-phosphopantetheinyl transferase